MPHATAATPPSGHRPRWWTELPLIAVVYGLYSMGRLLVHENIPAAVDNGLAILRLEKALHLNAEHPLNRLLTANPALGIPADFAYASLHYLVTPAVLVWIFRRRSAAYRAARTWLMTSTLLGLVGFTLMPTCPPRLLDAHHGFVDTMAQYSSYGWWGAGASAPRGLSGMTNQYAAMPSLHVGWAVWCGVLLWRHGRHPLVRTAGVAYPLITVLVVMGTANHYFLDAVAGAAVMAVGALLTRPFMRLADRVKDRVRIVFARVPASVTPAKSPIVSGGCKTSAGERIPGQRTASADSSDARTLSPAEADDDAPAAAR
ncbi:MULTISPECIES: phosphatase PAP2 family protein [unclassified Streptomyces]|uniref:phosphatase PAP2 family protein n=1 Tax=unclassified Streptomyces TaxID=2593676 RepID=UPI0011CC026B|nr:MULTISPECIES: phosphatase PAP2 family protein [unclassified Streptomyces]WSQ79709.1 phosphatase PAP2 family protein [Streptomyces sp. NBC_01213]TXS09112.1 phosphatase PAP2 family protein [Streptomyces sp. wa22]WSQ87089.1 phosphatase PAP2 family protein [Streptomyces sp. NBC_01212]WSR06895.1 phosphatase PAP2 family protein [Streptomyces sp. NBC_01208]WSR50366.1 phosphatase PAP2 family protein [Streptomyces sp. NBC_01201]